jgi:hypothetical protein
MIVVELHSAYPDSERPDSGTVVARLTARGKDFHYTPTDWDFDPAWKVKSLQTGELITVADNAEDWVRSLVGSLRTPYLWAQVIEDTDPLKPVEIEPADIALPDLHPAGTGR